MSRAHIFNFLPYKIQSTLLELVAWIFYTKLYITHILRVCRWWWCVVLFVYSTCGEGTGRGVLVVRMLKVMININFPFQETVSGVPYVKKERVLTSPQFKGKRSLCRRTQFLKENKFWASGVWITNGSQHITSLFWIGLAYTLYIYVPTRMATHGGSESL